jgi:hypothetical protein
VGARAPRAYAAAADATLAAERAERVSPAAKAFFTRASRHAFFTRATPAAAQKAAAAHAQRQGDLGSCRASSWGLKAKPRPTSWTACV